MIVLHAGWAPRASRRQPCLAIWGERAPRRATTRPATKRSGDGPLPHPFAAPAKEIRRALKELGATPTGVDFDVLACLPSDPAQPRPSRPWLWDVERAEESLLLPWLAPALAVPPDQVLPLLLRLPGPDDDTPGVEIAADLRFWHDAARFTLSLLAAQRFRPSLVEEDDDLLAVWVPALEEDAARRLDDLAAAMPPAARAVTRLDGDLWPPGRLLSDFFDTAVDAFARRYAGLRKPAAADTRAWGEIWLRALGSTDRRLQAPNDVVGEIRSWSRARRPTGADTFRVCFRLEPPEAPDELAGTEDGIWVPDPDSRDWTLRYLLQAADDPSLLVPAADVWRERGEQLAFLNRTFDQPQERLLTALGVAARLFPPIEASLRQARPEVSRLTGEEAFRFVREASLLFQSSGFGVLLPDLGLRLGVRLKLSPAQRTSGAQGGVAGISFESIVNFDWQLAVGDTPLSAEEFDRLADLKVPLVSIRGQWVELRPEQAQQLLALWREHQADGHLSLPDALRMVLAPEDVAGLPVTGVTVDGWLREVVDDTREPGKLGHLPVPAGFVGQLRPYQATGYSWLAFLRRYGLGACLADDMGLGKTIQTIALLLHERSSGERKPALLVCPTSVVTNWQRELARFAPSITVMVHHGGRRARDDFAALARRHDVVITSYALVAREEKRLAEVDWGDVIIDEAQNIKNPSTRQARAIRALRADYRIALTGTPVENRLSELWSVFQFLNPGYLGPASDFQARFARPIERLQDAEASRRLKSLIAPFILRRVKTDPAVISDLPAKNEIKVFCALSKEQATLYEAVVRDSLKQIEDAEGIERRGLVLATLTKLKQVCNHPAQFLKDGSALGDRSEKLTRLTEMLDEVRLSRERALIFTQFAEMARMLQKHLEQTLGGEALLLSGSTPRKERDRMIDRFQNDPHAPFAFILSLKAGGTGLNLTRASQVFHFDRWWNPAVENQATDRAFRIGQTRNVQVFKFVCAGTMEERIDEMIERKLGLASAIVGTSEAWISELSTAELRDIFELRRDVLAVAAD